MQTIKCVVVGDGAVGKVRRPRLGHIPPLFADGATFPRTHRRVF